MRKKHSFILILFLGFLIGPLIATPPPAPPSLTESMERLRAHFADINSVLQSVNDLDSEGVASDELKVAKRYFAQIERESSVQLLNAFELRDVEKVDSWKRILAVQMAGLRRFLDRAVIGISVLSGRNPSRGLLAKFHSIWELEEFLSWRLSLRADEFQAAPVAPAAESR